MSEARTLITTLRLPFDAVRTIYNGPSEVRLYRNEITRVLQIGKRVSWLGNEKAVVVGEATLLQKIRHDHIVPVVDVAVVDDPQIDADVRERTIEMIIPYYERGSIYDALEKGERFSVAEAVRLTRDSLAGLRELHETHRLLHRDVKSGNVFIDEKGHARIGDLGIAIAMETDGAAEAFPANQLYTAPETLVTRRCDRRSDLYGMGLILFELLNGPFPYVDYTPAGIFKRLEQGRRPIRERDLIFKPFVPSRLRAIVNKASARDATKRFSTAREMIEALDRAPFVDWRMVSSSADELIWEGAASLSPHLSYQVHATRTRKGWKLTGRRRVNQWQRVVDDQLVADPLAREAAPFFDSIVAHATNR